MSVEFQATIVCDGCGKRIVSEVEHRSTRVMSAFWDIRHTAREEGWSIISRGRFHTHTHWCKECGDKPMRPVPRKKRIKQ